MIKVKIHNNHAQERLEIQNVMVWTDNQTVVHERPENGVGVVGSIIAAEEGKVDSERIRQNQNIFDVDNGALKDDGLENVAVVEDFDSSENQGLSSDDVEPINQETTGLETVEAVIDDGKIPSLASVVGTGCNAGITLFGDVEALLA